jgi:hypothetical protein
MDDGLQCRFGLALRHQLWAKDLPALLAIGIAPLTVPLQNASDLS